MPHDFLRPRRIREHVFTAETVDTRRLREESALSREDALPGIEEDLASGIHNW